MRTFSLLSALFIFAGCSPQHDAGAPRTAPVGEHTPHTTAADALARDLQSVLDAQPDGTRARFAFRHPSETLKFFEIEAGQTVVEALPGGGWYTKILMPVVGPDGHVIGADYAQGMYPLFGFFDAEFIEAKKTWAEDWTAGTADWGITDGAPVSAFAFGSMPADMQGTADRVLFIRALHNLARFEDQGEYLSKAIQDAWNVLKSGGIVGVVQHHARDDMPDDWADGSNGYLKKGFVIEQMQAAGFELVGESDVNANPNDQPTTDDFVWRLPPSYNGAPDTEEARAALDAIGESNRMTLKFRKP